MTVLSDVDLLNYIKSGKLKVIPLSEDTIRENGLDLRLGGQLARFKGTSKVFEPGADLRDFYEIEEAEDFLIRPHEHVLLHTIEYIKLPNDLMGFVNLRSTFARLGLFIPPCLHPDTYLLCGDGSVRRACEVNSTLVNFSPETHELDCAEVKRIDSWSEILVEIETERSSCKVTSRHKFLTYRNGEVMELMAIELKPGDLLAVPSFPPPFKRSKFTQPEAALAKLVGYVTGRGVKVEGAVKVEGLHPSYASLIRELGGSMTPAEDGETLIRGRLARLLLERFPEALKGMRCREVPKALPPHASSIYLAGLFDSSAHGNGDCLALKIYSERLAKQVQLLLLKEGIYPFIEREADYMILKIGGLGDLKRFEEAIGRHCSIRFVYEARPCLDDYVYLTEGLVRSLKNSLRDLGGEILKVGDAWLLPRWSLTSILNKVKDPSLARGLLKASKLRWDRVIAVRLVKYGGPVVDFEEPTTNHYLTGPFITHNTVIDAGFEGQLTIELIGGEFPVRLRKGTRFLHVVFAKLTSPVKRPYGGRYQGQRGVKLPKF